MFKPTVLGFVVLLEFCIVFSRALTFLLPLNLSFLFRREGVKNDREKDRRAVRVRGNNNRQKDSENKGGDRREKQICQHTGKVSALLSDRKRRENEKELMSSERERVFRWSLISFPHHSLHVPFKHPFDVMTDAVSFSPSVSPCRSPVTMDCDCEVLSCNLKLVKL